MKVLSCLLLVVGVAGAAAAATPTAISASWVGIPAWTDCCGCTYTQGQKVTDGSLASRYRALQTFTNTCRAGWAPAAAASLWTLDGHCATPTPTTAARPTPTPTPTARASTPTPTATTPFCPTETPPPTPATT